jgi:MFS family permease
MITNVGIGVITGAIGALPTYAAIGIAAPLLLVLLRIVQGLLVGGERSGAMTIVVENAPLVRTRDMPRCRRLDRRSGPSSPRASSFW